MAQKDKKLTYEELALPNYRNSRGVFANLNVSDIVKAAVLGQLNMLLVGETGCGKTQLAKDIYNVYFGGNKTEGGHGIFMRAHPEIDVYNEIFSKLDIKSASRKMTNAIKAKIFLVDELNRAPEVARNQFFGMGDGIMDYKGTSIPVGDEGQRILVATANMGNGEYSGTFKTDRALYNRLHFAIDFDFAGFKPTDKDEMMISRSKKANPNVKEARAIDISGKIKEAGNSIDSLVERASLESQAVLDFLRLGLTNCPKHGEKEKGDWSGLCQDCSFNGKNETLCSLIREPTRRTIEATERYAASLYFLSKLKNPEQKIDDVDLMFKAFELTGTFQHLLNPQVLQGTYHGRNPKMMSKVIESLKEDFKSNEDYILGAYEAAKNGRKITKFFEHNGQIGSYDSLSDKAKESVRAIEPFVRERPIRLDWMTDAIDIEIENSKKKEGK